MPENNNNRVIVNDAKERAQLAQIQAELNQQKKPTQQNSNINTAQQPKQWQIPKQTQNPNPNPKQKPKAKPLTSEQKKLEKQAKKYNVFRFSNWLLWITIAVLIICGFFIYTNFLNLGTNQYWGKEGGYSRVSDRGPLAQKAFDKINNTYQDANANTAKIEQRGPVVNLLVTVKEKTPVNDAKKFTDTVVTEFLTELGDARSAEAPYGNTFMKYELNIQVTQRNLAKPTDESLNKIGDLGGEQQKVVYPFFGTVRKGVMTWTNNVA